jgi:hypothetical protein
LLRIGQPLGLSEDIYCMAYISMLKSEHITLFMDIETGAFVGEERRQKIIQRRFDKKKDDIQTSP